MWAEAPPRNPDGRRSCGSAGHAHGPTRAPSRCRVCNSDCGSLLASEPKARGVLWGRHLPMRHGIRPPIGRRAGLLRGAGFNTVGGEPSRRSGTIGCQRSWSRPGRSQPPACPPGEKGTGGRPAAPFAAPSAEVGRGRKGAACLSEAQLREFSAARDRPRSEGIPGRVSGPGCGSRGDFFGSFLVHTRKPVFDRQRARRARERAQHPRRQPKPPTPQRQFEGPRQRSDPAAARSLASKLPQPVIPRRTRPRTPVRPPSAPAPARTRDSRYAGGPTRPRACSR